MAAKVKVNLLKVTQNTVKEFGEDDMATTAGALTYFTFLAIFPLIILVITIASFFIDTPEGRANLTNLIAGAFSGSDIHKLVNDAITNAVKDRGGAGIFSLVGLIFSASGIFGTLSRALTLAWEEKPKSQNLILNYLTNIASLGVAGILIVAVNIATILLTTIAGGAKVINFLGLQLPDWVFYLINIVISVLALWGVFILMYKYLPKAHIEFKDVIVGSLIGAVGWTLLKELFGFYLAHFGPQASTYGSLSTVVALLLYIYFASLVLLLGVEFCSEYSKQRKKNEVALTAGVATADQPAPDRSGDPRYAEKQRLASELEAVKARQQAREQATAAPAQAALVGAPPPEPTRPLEDPLTKSAPVVAAAAGAAVVAGVVANAIQRKK
jgi:membrane protein